MEEGFETQRAEYVYSTDSVNFVGIEEEQAKVKVEHSTATEGFVADENGHVTGLKVVNVAPGENGPFTRQPGTERVIPADLVLISVGFLHPDTTTLVDQLPVDLDGRGNVARNDKFATSRMAYSPAATPAAARASWYGPFPKAAPARLPWMNTSPVPLNFRRPSCFQKADDAAALIRRRHQDPSVFIRIHRHADEDHFSYSNVFLELI